MLRNVRGTKDICKETASLYREVIDCATKQASLYGYDFLEPPVLEYADLFGRSMGEFSDAVNKEMYSFQSRGGEDLCLRPEFTSSVVRSLLTNFKNDPLPVKLFSHGAVFRYERPQKGRQRQFTHINYECFGDSSVYSDIETIELAHGLLCSLGVMDLTQLRLNSLGGADVLSSYSSVLFKYLERYQDELSSASKSRLSRNVLRILDSKEPCDKKILEGAPSIDESYSSEARNRFDALCCGLNERCIPYVVDTSIVRGLDYYSHVIFEFITDKLGAQGTVVGGGRYDGLVADLTGSRSDIPAIGFAGGVERIVELMNRDSVVRTGFTVYVLSHSRSASSVQKAATCAYRLRNQGIVAIHDSGSNIAKLVGKASKKGARVVVIVGEDEVSGDSVNIKNLQNSSQFIVQDSDMVGVVLFLRDANNMGS